MRLTREERDAARDALKHGFADNFVELKGGQATDAHHRVQQVDGHVIAEDRGGWGDLAAQRGLGGPSELGVPWAKMGKTPFQQGTFGM